MATPAQPVEPHWMLASGSRVILVVSSGPPPVPPSALIDVPRVVGAKQGDALSALQDAGLSSTVFNDYSDSYKRGEVMGQLPVGGTTAPVGSEAVLLVSSGPAVSHTKSELLPEVVGKQEAEAITALQAASFSPQVVREPSQTVPAGTVIAQLPSRASLASAPPKKNNWVVWVATAAILTVFAVVAFFVFRPAEVAVPSVAGMTQEQATAALEKSGLTVGSIDATQSSGVAEGTVVAQDPPAGEKAREGDAVDLVVVSGKPMVVVPDVRNMNQAEATKAITDAKLQVSVTRQPSNTVDKGDVISQSPAAGQQVPEGTTVGIVISDGEQVSNVTVPQVTGLTRADAEKALTEAGLKPVVALNPSTDVAKDVVITQLPESGESVAPGTSIGIIVSSGPPASATTVDVPNVVGLTLAEAQQVVVDAGLEALPVAAAPGSGKPANQVVAQTPVGGTKLEQGASVVLFYSTGP